MLLKFTKMHGLGNDFMVVDGVRQKIFFSPELIRRLADRHRGVGFDQLLLVEPPYNPELDFHYRIFNADGSEVQMCGNGARCFVRFVLEQGLTKKRDIHVSTSAGVLRLKLNDDDSVQVNMGKPEFEPCRIPFKAEARADYYELEVDGEVFKVGAVSLGNPHVVTEVPDVKSFAVEKYGPRFEKHARFPEHVNAGFYSRVSPHEIDLRVYERGAGETLACGSGACAAVAVGVMQGRLTSPVKVNLPGGSLQIEYGGTDSCLMMSGPAVSVFEGVIEVR